MSSHCSWQQLPSFLWQIINCSTTTSNCASPPKRHISSICFQIRSHQDPLWAFSYKNTLKSLSPSISLALPSLSFTLVLYILYSLHSSFCPLFHLTLFHYIYQKRHESGSFQLDLTGPCMLQNANASHFPYYLYCHPKIKLFPSVLTESI